MLITIISHITQVILAYQRNKDNRWNEEPSLAEISCNFLATAAPAMTTYFQHYRASRNQPQTNHFQTMNSTNPIYHEDGTLGSGGVQIASSSPSPPG